MKNEVPASSADLDVLRAFEPVVRYTKGERFFPMDVEPYVLASSLWVHTPDGGDEELVAEGDLTLERLVEQRDAPFGAIFYLRFVQELDLQESARALADERKLGKKQKSEFHAGVGRLARGGLLPRIGDALFSLSLLLRGKVPGATAASAALKYAQLFDQDGKYVYHGRIVRQSGWTICQYWFFLAYNPWRSGFHGVNDHESDWEMASVYLYEEEGALRPEWVAYASHDFHGADLRRRWDDGADIEHVDGHPVVYAGAGSHASYFRRGEYQAEVALPLPHGARRALEALGRFWRTALGQAGDNSRWPLRIPFVDFARGDGIAVGPGQEHEWTPRLIDESTPWVAGYRGLWGLYARDPISGENAPAGPMYERDGTPRPSWFDPLGFAGLDQVPTPPNELDVLERERIQLENRQGELSGLIEAETSALQELGVRVQSMRGSPHLTAESAALEERIVTQSLTVRDLRRERSENEAVLESLGLRVLRRRAGERDDPRAHIRHAAEPVPESSMRFDRAVEVWASLSVSLLLAGLAALVLAAPGNVWAEAIVLVLAFIVCESVLRGRFTRTVNRLAVLGALAAALVVLVQFWRIALVVALAGLAIFLLAQRLRERRG